MNNELLERIIKLCKENIGVDRSMTTMREDLGLNRVEYFAKEILNTIYGPIEKDD